MTPWTLLFFVAFCCTPDCLLRTPSGTLIFGNVAKTSKAKGGMMVWECTHLPVCSGVIAGLLSSRQRINVCHL